jgi:rhodanese-related sulfurtransferase
MQSRPIINSVSRKLKNQNSKGQMKMKKIILMILLVTTVAFAQQGAAPGKAPKSQAKVLTLAEFDALIANPDQILIIDVRRPDEITANGGFPVYLSIQAKDLEKSLAWIPKDRAVITVSNHAARGGVAADLLTKNGFKVAGTIGAQTYEQEGGKLTKIAPPPSAASAAGEKKGGDGNTNRD